MKIIKNNYVWIFSFLITIVFFITYMLIFSVYPFGDKTIVTDDCYYLSYPMIAMLHDKLVNHDGLFYYWNGGLGTDFLSTYFFHLASPANFLLFFIDSKHIHIFIVFSIIIKISMSAGTFGFLLSRRTGSIDNRIIFIPISCAYALSNYMLAYYHECMWLDSFVLLPIVIFGYGRMMRKRNPDVYILSLVLSAYCNFYIVFITGIFLIVWFLLDNHQTKKQFLNDSILFGLSSLISIGMSSVVLIISYIYVSKTHVSSEGFESHEWYGNIFEVIRNLFMSSKTITVGSKENAANIYSGVFTVVIILSMLFIKEINYKEKIKRILVLLFLLISMNENILNFIWHGFHRQILVPNRFAFVFVFLMLYYSADIFCYMNKNDSIRILIGGTLAEVLLLVSYFFEDFDSYYSSEFALKLNLFMILIYAVLFFLILYFDGKERFFVLLTSLVMILEIVFCAGNALSKCLVDGNYGLLNVEEYSNLISSVEEKDSSKFYRSDIIFNDNYPNSGYIFNQNSVKTFNSIFPKNKNEFGDYHGLYISKNFLKMYGTPELLDDIFSEKYIYVEKNIDCYYGRADYKRVGENDNINVYRNSNSMSLGFGVNSKLEGYSIESNDRFYNLNNFAGSMADVEDIYVEPELNYTVDSEGGIISLVDEDYLCLNNDITDFSNNKIIISFDVSENGEYYAYFLNNRHQTVSLYVNGVFHRSFIIDSSGISYIGGFEEKDNVRIEFVCMDYSETETIGLRVAMENKYCMNNFVNYVKKNQMNIITMNSDKIEGEINIDKGQLLFTSIPYDEGWHIYENGKELKVLKLASAFVGVKLGEGKHRIVFKYVPQGWYLSLVISFLSWIIFLLWMGIIQSDKTKRTTKVF